MLLEYFKRCTVATGESPFLDWKKFVACSEVASTSLSVKGLLVIFYVRPDAAISSTLSEDHTNAGPLWHENKGSCVG